MMGSDRGPFLAIIQTHLVARPISSKKLVCKSEVSCNKSFLWNRAIELRLNSHIFGDQINIDKPWYLHMYLNHSTVDASSLDLISVTFLDSKASSWTGAIDLKRSESWSMINFYEFGQ